MSVSRHCAVVMPTPERTRQSASYFIARQLVATDPALSQVSAQTRSRFDFLGHSPDFTGRTDRTAGRRHVDDHSSLTQVWWGRRYWRGRWARLHCRRVWW